MIRERRRRRRKEREEKRDANDVVEDVERPKVMKDCHLTFLKENQKDSDNFSLFFFLIK